MVRNRQKTTAGSCLQRDYPANVPAEFARHIAVEDLDPLFARGVADGDKRLPIRQPLTEAVAHAVAFTPLADRTFPESEAEHLAAHVHGQAVAGRMHAEGAKMVLGLDEAACRLRAMGEHLDFQRHRPLGRRIEQPDVRATQVDDARAIALRVSGVKRVVVGVSAPITAVRPARVEVGHAFEVRKEEHAVAHPHRAGDVAGQLVHTPKLPTAFGIDPQVPGRAALVALPARRIGGVAPDDLGSSRMQREMIDLAVRDELGMPPAGSSVYAR